MVFLFLPVFACFDFAHSTYNSIMYGIKGFYDRYEDYDR